KPLSCERVLGSVPMGIVDRRTLLTGALAMAAAAPCRRAMAQDRAAILEGARKEGKLAFAHSISVAGFPRFMEAFAAKYPFLETSSGLYSAPTGRVLARVDAELQSNSLTFDVLHVANLGPYLTMARRGQLLSDRSPELAAYPAGAAPTDQ